MSNPKTPQFEGIIGSVDGESGYLFSVCAESSSTLGVQSLASIPICRPRCTVADGNCT